MILLQYDVYKSYADLFNNQVSELQPNAESNLAFSAATLER